MFDLILVSGFYFMDSVREMNLTRRTISIASLYNSLKNNLNVKVYVPEMFLNFENLPEAKYYGVSIFYHEVEFLKKFSDYVKNKYPNSIVLCGGGFPTIYHEEVLSRCPNLDFVVLGDGIVPMKNILLEGQNYNTHKNTVTRDHVGISSLLEGEALKYSNLITNKDAFIDNNPPLNVRDHNIMYLVTSQGCPYSCSFCCNDIMYGHNIIYRDLNVIKEDFMKIFEDESIEKIMLTEAMLNVNNKKHLEYVENLFKAAIDAGFNKNKHQLVMFIKPSLYTDEYISLLKKYSEYLNYSFIPGIENFNNDVLKYLNKHETRESLFNMFKKMKDNPEGIKYVGGHIIFGSPIDTDEILNENIEYSKQVIDLFKNTNIEVALHPVLLQVYMGSNLYNDREKYNDFFDPNMFDSSNIVCVNVGLNKNWAKVSVDRFNIFEREITKYQGEYHGFS